MRNEIITWLVESGEPWTQYRTLVDLVGLQEDEPRVMNARQAMIAHPQIRAMIDELPSWPGYPLKRHNDAKHPLYKLSTLADMGIRHDDPGIPAVLELVLANQSPEGAFQILINIAKAFGGSGEDEWTWISCDAPTILYVLLAMGLGYDPSVQRAVEHLVGLVEDGGWRCKAAPKLGKFKGPGRKDDPCPIVNVYALKALAQVPALGNSDAVRTGVEMLLNHWEQRKEKKYFLFAMGTDFGKLKYPFIWYDILHVVDVLSRFPWIRSDKRFEEMVDTIAAQADSQGRFTASSMYTAWKGWSFADKKNNSPWLTFLVWRILGRLDKSL
ncbi:MAG: hypothetical protein JXA42_00300 [Anaerolineales bacterium]|nr:hypothetical protein [Anaerolineales bacterium]